MRAIARRQLAKRAGGTLNTTGLVHEAYLRLANRAGAHWNNRGHFLALSSLAMRHVLVDRAKAGRALKRGGAVRPVTSRRSWFPPTIRRRFSWNCTRRSIALHWSIRGWLVSSIVAFLVASMRRRSPKRLA